MSRAPHSRWHEAAVLATAATTILAIWATYHLTEPTTSAPDTSPSARAETHTTTLLSGQPSRGGARTTPPPPPRGVGALNVRGRSEPNGEVKPRPVVDPWAVTLACIRAHESDEAGGYRAVNVDSGAAGAYQMMPEWSDDWARRYGYPQWAGLTADQWPPAVQDAVAIGLLEQQGTGPWAGSGC